MPALTRPPRTVDALRVRGALWLALLALLLRAVLPAGYMPDARSLRHGTFEIAFCSVVGGLSTQYIALPPAGKDGGSPDSHPGADSGAQCPFGLLAHVTPAPVPSAALLTRSPPRQPASVTQARFALPLQPAQGPPLGSRAPPLIA